MSEPSFREELICLLNKHSMENGSDTPDFILAHFLNDCLNSFDSATNQRNKWYCMSQTEGTKL